MFRTMASLVLLVSACTRSSGASGDAGLSVREAAVDVRVTEIASSDSGAMVERMESSPDSGIASVDADRADEKEAKEAPCVGALREVCAGECPMFAGAVARLTRELGATEPCTNPRRTLLESGDCGGGLRYLQIGGGGFQVETQYFNAAGRLVAAEATSDYPAFCGRRSHHIAYGPAPKCTRQTLTRRCGKPVPCQAGDPLCIPDAAW